MSRIIMLKFEDDDDAAKFVAQADGAGEMTVPYGSFGPDATRAKFVGVFNPDALWAQENPGAKWERVGWKQDLRQDRDPAVSEDYEKARMEYDGQTRSER